MAAFEFKVEPRVGETVDAWMDRAYSDEARGPGNVLVRPFLGYAALNAAELEMAVRDGGVPRAVWGSLLLTDDPCSFVGKVRRDRQAILAFDFSGLDPDRDEPRPFHEILRTEPPALGEVVAMWERPGPGLEPVMLSPEVMLARLGLVQEGPRP